MKQIMVIAGGCFWGMEHLLRKQQGVLSTEVGYCGGVLKDPTYTDVKTGQTNHAESVRVTFDSRATSLETLLHYFFRIHDPTTLNSQGSDIGSQYRSVIFYTNEEEKTIATEVINDVNSSGRWPSPVVTELKLLENFYLAEDYHQDYLVKNPAGYTCHFFRE